MIIDESNREDISRIYFSVHLKFVVSLIGACFWTIFSIWIAQDWMHDLSTHIGHFLYYLSRNVDYL